MLKAAMVLEPDHPGALVQVRVVRRSISPPWGSIRFRLALRTYAPWGVRVVSQTKSRKIPTRNILPLFFVLQRGQQAATAKKLGDAIKFMRKGLKLNAKQDGADQAWMQLAGYQCERHGSQSAECEAGWVEAFYKLVELTPIDRDLAAQTASSAGNVLLQRAGKVTAVQQALGDRAVELGVLMAPLQMPQILVHDVTAMAWRDDAHTWHAVKHLEKHYEKIREEVLAAYGVGDLSRKDTLEEHGLHYAGRWDEINLLMKGTPVEKNMRIMPYTSNVIMGLRDARCVDQPTPPPRYAAKMWRTFIFACSPGTGCVHVKIFLRPQRKGLSGTDHHLFFVAPLGLWCTAGPRSPSWSPAPSYARTRGRPTRGCGSTWGCRCPRAWECGWTARRARGSKGNASCLTTRTRREPFNFTPLGVNPISSGSQHVRPVGRTCGEPDEIKKNTHPKYSTALFRESRYVHDVWHNGTEKRIVLIVDIWNPQLAESRRFGTIRPANTTAC